MIEPDIISMAKGMGNGFPIGGILIHPRFEASKGLLGTTFGGNHLACAAGIAVLDIIKAENLRENALAIGDYFMKALQQVEGVKEVRGRGLMIGLDLGFPVKALRKEMLFSEQVFTGSSSDPNVLRILPPLNIGTTEVDHFMAAFKKVLAKHLTTI